MCFCFTSIKSSLDGLVEGHPSSIGRESHVKYQYRGAEGFLNNIAPQEKKNTLTPLANSEGKKKISSGGGGFDMSFWQTRTDTDNGGFNTIHVSFHLSPSMSCVRFQTKALGTNLLISCLPSSMYLFYSLHWCFCCRRKRRRNQSELIERENDLIIAWSLLC